MGILSDLFKGRERRGHPSNPGDWLLGLSGGIKTYAGNSVTEENSLKSTAVFSCVRVLAESVAMLPLHLYRRTDGGKARATDHSLYRILHRQPNPEMTSFIFRETLMGHLVGWGNCYAQIIYGGNGQVTELWPLRPDKMSIERVEGELVYEYITSSGQPRILLRSEVFHVAGLGFDGIQGYSPIAKAREAIGLSLATEEFGSRFFGNGARPGAVLEHPGQLGKPAHENLRASWKEKHQGLSQAHNIAILEEGMKLHEIGIPPEDAQFLETRKFQVNEIARLYRVPPHMIGDLEKASFSNIEQQSIDFVVNTLTPWLVRWEQGYDTRLLANGDEDNFFAEHLIEGLLRGDIAARYSAYAVGRQWGWLSANEIRRLENMNPIDKGGDIYLVPMNMTPSDQLTAPLPVLPGQEDDTLDIEGRVIRQLPEGRAGFPKNRDQLRKRYKPLFLDAAQRFVTREVLAIKRQAGKDLTRNLQAFKAWMEEFYKDLPKHIRKNFMPVLISYIDAIQEEANGEIGLEPEMTPELKQFAGEYLDRYSQRHIDSSIGQLQALIRDTDIEELRETIEQKADEWGEKRPARISMNETARSGNATAALIFFGAGYKLIWRNSGTENCPYCDSMEGKVISKGQYFVKGNTDLQPDGTDAPMKIFNSIRHAPLHGG
ncbi:MAG TPA: phage portal protein [bacterium]|nr:phage portal protein [bacterium]